MPGWTEYGEEAHVAAKMPFAYGEAIPVINFALFLSLTFLRKPGQCINMQSVAVRTKKLEDAMKAGKSATSLAGKNYNSFGKLCLV
jgi:hypothetical protein